ncbi:MAG: Integral rane sensor signal transduction histidine kinase [Pedosphaera sp.]|nr:Integral rane sensor signal transduction histidine kinase [Pedosphaera sp.]
MLLVVCLVGVFDAGSVQAANEATGRNGKIITQYALVSANDFPQRDPLDWRLLGSNDGGKTWVTLDTRKNELFSERHQRRAFKVASPAAYETYRLQIDHVRERRVANSVQLAEIVLMGKSEDDLSPVPIFTDSISAQGDNPPAESASKLFDGRVETKWLDRPADRVTCASWIQWQYSSPTGVLVTNVNQIVALRGRAVDGYQVQLDGVVAGYSEKTNTLYFLDSTGGIEFHGLSDTEELKTGQHVTLKGTTELRQNRIEIAHLSVHHRDANLEAAPERIALEQELPAGEDLKWVELEGRVEFGGSSENEYAFDLQDANRTMRVHLKNLTDSESLPATGTRVSVRGICRGAYNDQGQWVAARLWASGVEAMTPVDQSSGAVFSKTPFTQNNKGNGNAAAITKIDQIRKLTPGQLNSRPRVKIRGIITDLVGAFIQDDTAGIQVAFPPEESRKITEAGMFVEIEGWGGLGDVGNPVISADRITVLGRGKFPQPQRLSLSQLMSGRMDAQWIEMEGVVRATDGAHLLMICYGREVMASIGAGSVSVVNGLVDAAVRVRGVGVTALDDRGRIQGIHLLIPSLEQLEVVEAPVDPFLQPIQPIGSLLGLSGPRESFHRVHLKGVLTLQEGQNFFLQDNTGSAMGILKTEILLDARFGRSRWLFWQSPQNVAPVKPELQFAPGDKVEVVGFPETRGYSPVLTEVTVRKVGGPLLVKGIEATPDAIAAGTLDSALVTLDGIVRGQNALGVHNALALEWADRTLQVLVSTNVELPAFLPGTRLRVTGVCQIDQMPYAELGLRVGAVRILPRSAEDFVVLARPPWWTVRRALAAMGGMAFVILAAFIWIKQLRRQVEERTNQLTSEIQLREQTERQRSLEKERSRIAQDLHDDLGANLTQIVFLSQRVEAAQQDAQEVDRWFRLIPATAKKTIQSLDEIVWAINPRNDSLESFANYLSQFAQQHMTLARVRCVLDVPTVLPAVPLTAEVRHKLLLAAREALQNVATHAAATEARVTLQQNEYLLAITITDNGHGFDIGGNNSEGNGLSNMRRRLEDIGGMAEITSQPGKGTTVRLVIERDQLHGRVIGANGHS